MCENLRHFNDALSGFNIFRTMNTGQKTFTQTFSANMADFDKGPHHVWTTPQQQQQPPMYVQQRATDDGNSCISSDPKRYRRAHTIMGSLQIIIGIAMMIFSPMLFAVKLGMYGGGVGFSGIFFILAGAFGIAGRTKKRCPLITSMVFCIMAAVIAVCVMSACTPAVKEAKRVDSEAIREREATRSDTKDRAIRDHHGHWGDHREDWGKKKDWDSKKNWNRNEKPKGKLACYLSMIWIVSVLALLELIVSIVHAVYCCKVVCCRSSVQQEPIIIYMNGPAPGYAADGGARPKVTYPNLPPIQPTQPPAYSIDEEKKSLEI